MSVDGRTRALTALCALLLAAATVRALPHSLPAPSGAAPCPAPSSRAPSRWEFRAVSCRGAGAVDGSGLILLGLRMDVNTASVDDLETLPGIGARTAQRIVEHREAHGRFDRVDALTDVKGVGPRTVERLRPFVDAR